MGWLDKIAPFRKGGTALAEATDDGIVGVSSEEASGPPLVCLVTDASGTATYKRHVFSDIESATDFVLYWFPNQNEGGIISFWAMTYEPAAGFDNAVETVAEPLVMIRDHVREELVYLFSFTDIQSALAFLREEVRHGVDLGSLMLYWAVPVRMAADPWGKMVLTPSVAPGAAAPEQAEPLIADIWTATPAAPVYGAPESNPIETVRAVFEEAPNADTGVADPVVPGMDTFELTSWMDQPRKKPARDKETAAKVREWLAQREADDAERQAETRWEPRAEKKDTAAQVREWLAQREVKAAEPTMETSLEAQIETTVTPDVAGSLPIIEAEETVIADEDVQTAPLAIEELSTEVEQFAEPTSVAKPFEETFNAEPLIVSEPVETTIEPEAQTEIEPKSVTEVIDQPEPEAGSDPEPQFTAEAVVEVVNEPDAEVEVVIEPDVETVFEAVVEAEPEAEQGPVVAETADGTSEPEIRRTIRVHTNGNGHTGDFARQRKASEQDIAADEAEAGVHENGNGHERAARSQAYAAAPDFEYDSRNEDPSERSVDIRIEIHLDSRALKVKRWDKKEEPFDGFNSPPGRF